MTPFESIRSLSRRCPVRCRAVLRVPCRPPTALRHASKAPASLWPRQWMWRTRGAPMKMEGVVSRLAVNTRGSGEGDVTRSLEGTAAFGMKDGVLKGFNLAAAVLQAAKQDPTARGRDRHAEVSETPRVQGYQDRVADRGLHHRFRMDRNAQPQDGERAVHSRSAAAGYRSRRISIWRRPLRSTASCHRR